MANRITLTPHEQSALRAFRGQGRRLSVREVARATGLGRGFAYTAVRGLVRRGLAEKRGGRFRATDAGKAAHTTAKLG